MTAHVASTNASTAPSSSGSEPDRSWVSSTSMSLTSGSRAASSRLVSMGTMSSRTECRMIVGAGALVYFYVLEPEAEVRTE